MAYCLTSQTQGLGRAPGINIEKRRLAGKNPVYRVVYVSIDSICVLHPYNTPPPTSLEGTSKSSQSVFWFWTAYSLPEQ